jgi:hypothetical protein
MKAQLRHVTTRYCFLHVLDNHVKMLKENYKY